METKTVTNHPYDILLCANKAGKAKAYKELERCEMCESLGLPITSMDEEIYNALVKRSMNNGKSEKAAKYIASCLMTPTVGKSKFVDAVRELFQRALDIEARGENSILVRESIRTALSY